MAAEFCVLGSDLPNDQLQRVLATPSSGPALPIRQQSDTRGDVGRALRRKRVQRLLAPCSTPLASIPSESSNILNEHRQETNPAAVTCQYMAARRRARSSSSGSKDASSGVRPHSSARGIKELWSRKYLSSSCSFRSPQEPPPVSCRDRGQCFELASRSRLRWP